MSLEMYSVNPDSTGLGQDDRIFAIGDIHGQVDDLDRILDGIFKHMNKAQMKDQIIFLGDYIDRGKHSFEVISRLIDLDRSNLETTFILGNHEDYLLKFLEFPSYGPFRDWVYCGGFATVQSYLNNMSFSGCCQINFSQSLLV